MDLKPDYPDYLEKYIPDYTNPCASLFLSGIRNRLCTFGVQMCASCCMNLSTTPLTPVNHALNDINVHYVFYCDFVRASELGPAAVAGCFLTKVHRPCIAEMYVCCAATRSRWTSSTRSICVLVRTFLTLYSSMNQ